MPKGKRTWDNESLRRAVLGDGNGLAPAESLFEITRRLGIRQGGTNNRAIKERAALLKLPLPDYRSAQATARLAELEYELSRTREILGLEAGRE